MFDMMQPLVNQPGERWEYGVRILVCVPEGPI